MKILVIGGSRELKKELSLLFTKRWLGVDLVSAIRLETGLEVVAERQPEIIILDADSLLGGLEALRQIRVLSPVPLVVIISGENGNITHAKWLDEGADLYFPRLFDGEIFLRRVNAFLRLSQHAGCEIANYSVDEKVIVGLAKKLVFNFTTRRVTLDGKIVPLTRVEFNLFYVLAENAGRVVTKEELLLRVWRGVGSPNLPKVFIQYLRKKLGLVNAADLIITERGVGYKLNL